MIIALIIIRHNHCYICVHLVAIAQVVLANYSQRPFGLIILGGCSWLSQLL